MRKGIIYHTISKVAVILSAYILHFFLGKMMTVEEYGIVGMIINLTNFYYLFLTNGVRQSISKQMSEEMYSNREIVRKGMTIQIVFGVGLGIVNYLFAPLVANAFGNPALAVYFEMTSFLVPLTALYFGFTGALNGMKLFLLEGIVMIVYPMVRLSAIPFTGVFPEAKPIGTVIGFILGSLVAAVLAIIFSYRNKKINFSPLPVKKITYKESTKEALHFMFLFAGVTVLLNLHMLLLTFIKGSEELTGYYTAINNFSLVPYYLVSAVYLVILPFVTESYAKGDSKAAVKMISKNLYYLSIVVLPIVILIAASSETLLGNFYNEQYTVAASSLTILVFGIFFLSLFVVFTVCLNGVNKHKITNLLSALLVVGDVGLLFWLVPIYGMAGAALATLIIGVAGAVLSYVLLCRALKCVITLPNWKKLLIIMTGFTVGSILIFRTIHFSNLLWLILGYIIVLGLFLFVAIKCKIIQIDEIKNLLMKRNFAKPTEK